MAIKDELTSEVKKEITLSDRAAQELKSTLAENDKAEAALRVWVSGGGCSGLTYGMAIDDAEPEADDNVLEDRGIRIYVDSLSLRYMSGSVIEYVDDTLGGGFKIENPNATKSCGCGSSFAADEEGLPGLETGGRGGCGGCGCG
ncbi:MAG TPA: iron-sulfur cluster assembly accessory protein [Fimbriimonadaceae bacterium]|nr:iron-sulfur cluster assembly accessory protein [Fimbriimonadaceae bacterium]